MRVTVTDSRDTVWLQDYVAEHPTLKGMYVPVTEIKVAESGKGYVLLLNIPTDEGIENVSAFNWKKGKVGEAIRAFFQESNSLLLEPSDSLKSYPVLMCELSLNKSLTIAIDEEPVTDTFWVFQGSLKNPGDTAVLVKKDVYGEKASKEVTKPPRAK